MSRMAVGLMGAFAVGLLAYVTAAQPPGGGPGRGGFGPPQFPLMTALDADQDGEISPAEIEGAAAALKKLDKNGDGKLVWDEVRPQFGGPGGGRPGMGGPGPGMRPGRGRPPQAEGGAPSFEAAPVPKDDAEEKILAVLDDMNRNQRRRTMNVPMEDGRLLRLLAETIDAKHVVEIGTSSGYSTIWLCLALRTTGGKLVTHEINAERAAMARENFKRAGVDGIVTLVEGDAHEQVAKLKEPIDLLFLDADKQGYIDYLEKLLPLVRPGGLVVAHNMSPRQADPDYVKAVTTNPDLETIFLHMDAAGVGVTMKKR